MTAARALLALALLLASLQPAAHAQPASSITVAVRSEPDRLYNPSSPAARLAANLIYDPLVGLDDQMQPYPVLAAAVPSLENGLAQMAGDGAARRLEVTVPLRGDVTWSDGTPFTAEDVVYTWQLMMNPRAGFDTRVVEKIRSIERLDDLTLRITYEPGRADPLFLFGLYGAPGIYPRHKLREILGDDPRGSADVSRLETDGFLLEPIGTGPYVLSARRPGASMTFTSRRLALPHRLGVPRTDTIVFRVMPERDARLSALDTGEVQVIAQDGLDMLDAPVLDAMRGVRPAYTRGVAWEHLTFNLTNPILADRSVRVAIAHAIDRTALNEAVAFGKGEVPSSQLPSWSFAAKHDLPPYPFDPGIAQNLLQQAGWTRLQPDGAREKQGQRLTLRLWTTPTTFRPVLTAAIKTQLEQVGFEVTIDFIPAEVLFRAAPEPPQALAAGRFDMVEFAWVSAYDPGYDQVYSMHAASIPSVNNNFRGGNYGGYRSQRTDQVLDQTNATLDDTFRRVAFYDLQALWHTDLPALPLLLWPTTSAASERLFGYRPSPSAGETWNVEEWELQPLP